MKRLPRPPAACLLVACLLAPSPRAQGRTQDASHPSATAGAEKSADAVKLDALLERVAIRVRAYHERLFSISFRETVRQERLRQDLTPKARPEEFVYESLVLRRPARAGAQETLPVVTRKLMSRDGRAVDERGEARKREARARRPARRPCGVTDPPDVYGDPLLFLLPERRAALNFSYEGEAALDGNSALVVSFESPPAAAPPELKLEGNCFFLSRPLRRKDRAWVDAETFDVLRLDWELAETFDAQTGNRVVRRGLLFRFAPSRELAYEREVTTIRFRPVAFQNPEQTLLLPVSAEYLRVVRGARDPGFRLAQTYADYRRYLTSSVVKETDDDPRL